MTVLSRGARSRRSGRRPGWALVTVLLVLAIAASSALVFTNRTELLKLAVILALWAAVVAAFISMIYRRQSDVDQAKARDLKLVYDLQLDREIAARREYELTVETALRRELAAELRAQSADEVVALRAELAALRNNLEILFETDLSHRPALETERTTVRAYSDWDRDSERTDPGRASRGRFTASARGDVGVAEEDHIIDVHEEPPEPEPWPGPRYSGLYTQPAYGGGAHRVPAEEAAWGAGPRQEPQPEPAPPEPPPQPEARPQPMFRPEPTRPEPPEPRPQPYFSLYPEPEPEPEPEAEAATAASDEWPPAAAEGEWLSAGAAGSDWASSSNGFSPAETQPPPEPVSAEPRRGRHSSGVEITPGAPPPPPQPESSRRARHSAEAETYAPPSVGNAFPTPPPTAPASPVAPAPRHGAADTSSGAHQHGEGHGQSVADLLARLQERAPSGGGRRRRHED